jgi:hypothetical protein
MSIVANDKNLIRQFVKINFINNATSYPDFAQAEEKYLLPLIGQELYDVVVAFSAAAPVDTTDQELLKKCRAVVVPLAYLIDLPTIQVQITDAGLRNLSTENLQSAHRWEYNEVRELLMDKGAMAIDALLKFLFAHAADYGEWTSSQEYEQARELIFKTGEEFDRFFRTGQPHRVFWELRPLIREVEDFHISSAIGEEFYKALKEDPAPTDEEKKALELIRKSVAQTTIVKAIEKLSVKITDKGFTIQLSAGSADASNSGDKEAKDNQLSMLYNSCERSGDSYLVQLKEYLNKNASVNLFQLYFESALYQAPNTVVESPNCNRRIFGL